MENFFAEHWEIVVAFIVLLISIAGFFIKYQFNRLNMLEQEMKEIKTNYLNRFDDIKSHQAENNEKVMSFLSEVMIKITDIQGKVESQAKICEFVQESKKK